MTDRKPCVRCERAIDAFATICPFCNWNQAEAAPAQQIAPAPIAGYKPPAEQKLRKRILFSIAGAVLLIASFAIGYVINRDGAPKVVPQTPEEQMQQQQAQARVPAVKRADTPLVPVGDSGGVDRIEQPITSAPTGAAPAAGVPAEYQRSDATAVSAAEYAQMAQRAAAEKSRMAALVDPRSLTGAAYAQAQAPRRPRPAPVAAMPGAPLPPSMTSGSAPPAMMPPGAMTPAAAPRRVAIRTRPVPQFQPVPRLQARGPVRLDLIIGADGRVKEVSVRQSNGANLPALIAAVQGWRFKPATENGEPVASPFSVEISFR
jgi:periplasmic protein TonB